MEHPLFAERTLEYNQLSKKRNTSGKGSQKQLKAVKGGTRLEFGPYKP